MRFIRVMWRFVLALVALLAGCFNTTGQSVYGVPPPQKDPEVTIDTFTYEPAQGLIVGDQVVFKVTLSKSPDEAVNLRARFDSTVEPPVAMGFVPLNDLGIAPDQVSGDHLYTGLATLINPCESLPVAAVYFDLELFADPMTVLPVEEE